MSSNNSYRVFSFQSGGLVDILLEEGVANSWSWYSNCTDSDKYKLYAPLLPDLDEDAVPIFTFLRYNDNYLEYPISAQSLSENWFTFMKWFRLLDRYLIELEVPKEIGVIGKIEGCELLDFESKEKWLEFVLPYIKLEWVREIYKPIQVKDGVTTLEPLLNKYEDRLFNSVFKIGRIRSSSGVSKREACETLNIEDYLVNNKPIVDMSYGYNISRLTIEKANELLNYGMSKHFPEACEDDDLWNATLSKLYCKIYTQGKG